MTRTCTGAHYLEFAREEEVDAQTTIEYRCALAPATYTYIKLQPSGP